MRFCLNALVPSGCPLFYVFMCTSTCKTWYVGRHLYYIYVASSYRLLYSKWTYYDIILLYICVTLPVGFTQLQGHRSAKMTWCNKPREAEPTQRNGAPSVLGGSFASWVEDEVNQQTRHLPCTVKPAAAAPLAVVSDPRPPPRAVEKWWHLLS